MVSALAGKTRAVAIDVADGEVGPAFLRQPAQQPIRLFASAIDRRLFGQALDLGQVVIHQRGGALDVCFVQRTGLFNHGQHTRDAQYIRRGLARDRLDAGQLTELARLALDGVVNINPGSASAGRQFEPGGVK
ncbi:hypothetical protein D3C78_968740 [compost metagenome]